MEKIKIIEKLEMLIFFNQRAGRELWANKPKSVQDEDIANAEKYLRAAIEMLSEAEGDNADNKQNEEIPVRPVPGSNMVASESMENANASSSGDI